MQRAQDLIIKHEGIRDMPYKDSAGILTIGVGHNLTSAPLHPKVVQLMFAIDYDNAYAAASLYPWFQGLGDVRQAVVVDMIFNLGATGFSKFVKFQAALSKGDYVTAAAELKNSKWATQVGVRATDLETMMLTGKWL